MSIFYEIKNYFNLLKKKDYFSYIAFYAEDEESFCHFEGLIDNLLKSNKIPILYITSDPNDKIFQNKSKQIKIFYFNKLLAPVIKNLKVRALIMTMPDLNKFHIKRSKFCNEHIYIFHNIGSSFTAIRFGALFSYDTLFCVGPHHRIETIKQENLYKLKNKKLVEYGYYKLESIMKDYYVYKKNVIKSKKSKDKIKILLAPSWGKNSILNYCGEELIKSLSAANYFICIRPHPMTIKHDVDLITNLESKFYNSKNIIFEKNISNTESFYSSDIMITDWSGVSYEYAFGTERPVLFVDVPQKIVNERYCDIDLEPIDVSIRNVIGLVLPVDKIKNIKNNISKLIKNEKSFKKSIVELREKTVYNVGNSSNAGADYINSIFN
tara:strand:+ start:2647 stop:3786 length:1140 start_codon:yes stop_codon:yes gene_type:complete